MSTTAPVVHGTPEGHAAGCKGDAADCPALYEHGMSCTIAFVRSTTTPDRYFKAKARDPHPAAIARTLGLHPVRRATAANAPDPGPITPLVPAVTSQTPTAVDEQPSVSDASPPPVEEAAPKPAGWVVKMTSDERRLIRAWAADNDLPCPVHGPIPKQVIQAYRDRPEDTVPADSEATNPGEDPAPIAEPLPTPRVNKRIGVHDSCFDAHKKLSVALDAAKELVVLLWDELEHAHVETDRVRTSLTLAEHTVANSERALHLTLQKWGAADARATAALALVEARITQNTNDQTSARQWADLPWSNDEVLALLGALRDVLTKEES